MYLLERNNTDQAVINYTEVVLFIVDKTVQTFSNKS